MFRFVVPVVHVLMGWTDHIEVDAYNAIDAGRIANSMINTSPWWDGWKIDSSRNWAMGAFSM